MDELYILGTGSAFPTVNRGASGQVLKSKNAYYLIDCGEGTQLKLKRLKIPFAKITAIFISHLHGDHYLGLPGLLGSFNLLNRTQPLPIIAPKGLKEIIQANFKYSGHYMSYEIIWTELSDKLAKPINVFETKHFMVSTFSLKHRIPCYGYLFSEKIKEKKLVSEALEKYAVPVWMRQRIKLGHDFEDVSGNIIPNDWLTIPPSSPIRFAYCSDNRVSDGQLDFLSGIEYLYHECTFDASLIDRAKKTMHSTTIEVANLAKRLQVKTLLYAHFSARYNTIELLEREVGEIFPNAIALRDEQIIKLQLK